MRYSKNNKNDFSFIPFIWIMCFIVGFTLWCLHLKCETPDAQSQTEPLVVTVKIITESVEAAETDQTIVTPVEEQTEQTESVEPIFTPLDVPLDVDIQEYIYELCDEYNMDFTFVMALIGVESSYQAEAVSSTSDYGLMQINRCNHEWLTETLGVTNYLDPYQNIQSGMYILKGLFEKYDDPEMVLMAYNMGERGASKRWNKGIYETDYSNAVMNLYTELISEKEG